MSEAASSGEQVRASSVPWLPAVEALRAVAASTVVAHHLYTLSFFFVSPAYGAAHPQAKFPGWRIVEGFGSWGVDLFFLLSGFLLCEYFWRPCRPSLRDYYRRRFFRIAPAYYVNVGLLFLFFAEHRLLFGASGARQVVANATFTHWLMPRTASSLNVNGALWTLSVEMLLYALMPLLAYAVARRPVVGSLTLLGAGLGYRAYVALAGGGLAEAVFPAGVDPDAGHIRLFLVRQFVGILPIFVIGVAARRMLSAQRLPAVLSAPHRRPSLLVLLALMLPSLLLLHLGVEKGNDHHHWIWFVGWDASLAAALVPALLYAARPVEAPLRPAMSAATWVGRRSYGLYLWHFPVILSVYGRGPMTRDPALTYLPLRILLVVLISLGLATASYALVERPGIAAGRAVRRRAGPIPRGGIA